MTGYVSKKMSSNSRDGNQEYYEYLEALRQSGVTNMFGAAVYLERDFGLDRYEARDILLEWMKGYGK